MRRGAERIGTSLQKLRRRVRRPSDAASAMRHVTALGGVGLSSGRLRFYGPRYGWLIDRVARTLQGSESDLRVAVIHNGTSGLPTRLERFIPGAGIHSFLGTEPVEVLHTRMAAHGPYRVIVDDTGQSVPRTDLLIDCFWHLTAGGTYVVRRVRAEAESAGDAEGEVPVERLIRRLARGKGVEGSLPPTPQFDRARLRSAIGQVEIEQDHIFVTSAWRRPVYAKVREEQVGLLLSERGPAAGTILTTRGAADLHSECAWRPWPPQLQGRERSVYPAPALSLREYHDVFCAQEQVVVQGRAVLPDSYRHIADPRLKNKALPEVARRFGVPRSSLEGADRLRGAYFYLDNEHRGHFGHVITEQVAKLWAWEEARARHPGIKALVAINRDREMADWEYLLLSAAGIDRSDVVVIRTPVRVQTLLSATPMYSHPVYVHPAIATTWRTIGDAMATRSSSGPWPRRIFCSRRITNRPCHNTEDVERIFSAHGFETVYTEDLALPDQVAMFRDAEVVAGFAGSALFNLCWVTEPKRVVIIAPDSYTARNEHMIGAVLGHQIDFVTSRPDIPHPDQGWSKAAFRSGFSFDPRREGAYLEDLLAAL